MDENRREDIEGEDKEYIPYSELSELNDNEELLNGEPEDYERTMVMNSIQIPKLSDDDSRGITPRDEFTDLNSADDLSVTRTMNSISGNEDHEPNEAPSAENSVKKRTKRKKINHTKTMGQVFLGAVISVFCLGVGIFLSIQLVGAIRDVTGMAKTRKEIDFEITENMSVDQIIDELHENGIIDMPALMKMYINFTKNQTGFLNGPHTINSGMSYTNIIKALQTEKEFTETITITIPEGLSVVDIGKLLEENYVCRASDFETYVKSKQNRFEFEEGLKSNSNRVFMMEGYLFPDTYEFYVVDYLKDHPNYDTSTWAKQAADKMMNNFDDHITKKMKTRMKELNMSLDQVVTLASIIQWEGNAPENMNVISSVFHNRLNDPDNFPNLQSDTIYTYIDKTIKPRTTSSNKAQMQKIENAYDTYKCTGLPAGPINNPGMDAINAALYPDETDYYYFLVARDGTFYYAQTHEQHEQNIIDADLRWEQEQGAEGNDVE